MKRGYSSESRAKSNLSSESVDTVESAEDRPPSKKIMRRTAAQTEPTISESSNKTPDSFVSAKGNKMFTKAWWKEVSARDEFWTLLVSNIPKQVLQKRIHAAIVTDLNKRGSSPGPIPKPKTKASERSRKLSPACVSDNEDNLDAQEKHDSDQAEHNENLLYCKLCSAPSRSRPCANWSSLGGFVCDGCLDLELSGDKKAEEFEGANSFDHESNHQEEA